MTTKEKINFLEKEQSGAKTAPLAHFHLNLNQNTDYNYNVFLYLNVVSFCPDSGTLFALFFAVLEEITSKDAFSWIPLQELFLRLLTVGFSQGPLGQYWKWPKETAMETALNRTLISC